MTGCQIADGLTSLAGIGEGAVEAGEAEIANPVPDRVARIIPKDINPTTLGNPADADVFVTDTNAIQGMNAQELANALGIPESESGFQVIEFDTPEGIASPINRANPGFVGGGLTSGGLPEYVVPNGAIPDGAIVYPVF